MIRTIARLSAVSGFALVAALGTSPVFAQSDAGSASSAPGSLPVAPKAERAYEGGLTGGHPSLAGANGSSPLEPYLVTWLLPASGLLAVLVAFGADRTMRNRRS